MPNCFQLTRRTALEAGAVTLQQVDKELCEHFQAPCDEKEWYCGWYNYIGFLIAMGKDWDWLTDDINKMIAEAKEHNDKPAEDYWSHMQEVRKWLQETFTYEAWVEIGKR